MAMPPATGSWSAAKPPGDGLLLRRQICRVCLCSGRLRLQIPDEATDTQTESHHWIAQRYQAGHAEYAQGGDRPEVHGPAHRSGGLGGRSSIDKLPYQANVSYVHQEEYCGIERNRLRCQFADSHPCRGEGQQRHGKQVRKIDPHQSRGDLSSIAHQIVVIGPYDGDEEVTHCIAEPGGPKQQQSAIRGRVGGLRSSTSTVMRTANTPSENMLSLSGVALRSMVIPSSYGVGLGAASEHTRNDTAAGLRGNRSADRGNGQGKSNGWGGRDDPVSPGERCLRGCWPYPVRRPADRKSVNCSC